MSKVSKQEREIIDEISGIVGFGYVGAVTYSGSFRSSSAGLAVRTASTYRASLYGYSQIQSNAVYPLHPNTYASS